MTNPTAAHHSFAHSTCHPLFIGDGFLRDGHSSSTPNATATFVSHGGSTYAITCRHVILDSVAAAGPGAVPRFHVGASIRPTTNFRYVPKKQEAEPQENHDEDEIGVAVDDSPDVAIADISPMWWSFEKAGKRAIDLEALAEPEFVSGRTYLAAGFLDEHKEHDATHVRTKLALLAATLPREPLPWDRTFQLQSQLDGPHGFFFSGISGGPVFAAVDEDQLTLAGIVYQGLPSTGRRSPKREPLFGPDFVGVSVMRLNAAVFERWLAEATERL